MEEKDLGRLLCERRNKRIYVRGDTLTKLYLHELMPKPKVIEEAWAQAVVEGTGLNVPKVRLIYPVGEDWAVDYDYIDGESLQERMEKHPENIKDYIKQLVKIQIQVLGATCVGLPDMKDKFNRKISALGRIKDPSKHVEATIRYELHVALDKMPAHRKLCHGDLMPDNILFDRNDVPYVIDWAHATLGNGAADAAHTALKMWVEGHKDWAKIYLSAYAKATDTAIQYISSWYPMVSATMLDKVDDPEAIKVLMKYIDNIEFQ